MIYHEPAVAIDFAERKSLARHLQAQVAAALPWADSTSQGQSFNLVSAGRLQGGLAVSGSGEHVKLRQRIVLGPNLSANGKEIYLIGEAAD